MTRREALCGAAAVAGLAGSRKGVRLVDSPGDKVSFLASDRPLFEYRYSAARPKTYVHPVYAPNGVGLTLDGAEGHEHHRGLMLAWSDVVGFDFWGELNPGPPHGQIVHQRFESMREGAVASVAAINHWLGSGEVLLVERQTVRAPAPSPGLNWLEWESELRAAKGAVTLSADKHPYDGLGIRFVPSMDGGQVLNANNTREIEKANGEPAAWCGYSGSLATGGSATVTIFDHPANPRHPTPFFVMNTPFGYLSAAPTFRSPLEVRVGEALRLRYALLIHLGEPDGKKLAGLYRRWSQARWRS